MTWPYNRGAGRMLHCNGKITTTIGAIHKLRNTLRGEGVALCVTLVLSKALSFSPLGTVELTTNWYQLHNRDYREILIFHAYLNANS